ncbi:MAG: sensor histidine kinase [Cyanobacteria bacterium P01_A01_bin.114]
MLTITLLNALFNQAVIEFPQQGSSFAFWFPFTWQFLGLVIVFGTMGLYLPKQSTQGKVFYTALEFSIIGIVSHLCCWDSIFFAPLLLIAAIRSCLLFEKVGQIIIAGAIFLFFAVSDTIYWSDVWNDAPFAEAMIEELTIVATQVGLAGLETLSASLPAEMSENLTHQHRLEIFQIQLQNAFFFGLVLVFVLLLINALVSERQNRRQLASAHAQLYEYAIRIEDQATLEERNRIARDIHDSLGHILMAQSIQLDNGLFFLQKNLQKAETFFEAGKQLTADALKELRQSISTLRSAPLQGETLDVAIAASVDNFRQVTNIEIECQTALHLPVSAGVRTAVFRIVEEALTNIYKHSRATQVSIVLHTCLSQERQPVLCFKVKDNGQGFLMDQNATGFGLKGMRERATAVGGQFKIASTLGKGCCISGSFPLGFSL